MPRAHGLGQDSGHWLCFLLWAGLGQGGHIPVPVMCQGFTLRPVCFVGGAQRGGHESMEVAGVGMDGSPVGSRVSVRLAIPSPPPPSSFLENERGW